jgi:aryl-alcohol dehydrogenase-like predicted oxidoreductase
MQCKVGFYDIVSMPLIQFADYAITNKLTPFISMQNHYNLIYREEEREMFPTLKVCRVLNQ